MGPIVQSTLDVALWFLDRADSAGREISPRKLHGLLFMAQARFANENGGRKLMPAIFLAAQTGPIEPTINHMFEAGRPRVKAATPGFAVEELLMETWDRFGELADAEFSRLTREHKLYQQSLLAGRNSEIEFAACARGAPASAPPPAREPTRAEKANTPVLAAKWMPGTYGTKPSGRGR